MKKPDAVTVIPKDSFQEKIWGLPAADLLGVGRATQRVLDSYCIRTIGDLAKTNPDFLNRRLGKNGIALWQYANGNDRSRVMNADFISPVKSVGHGITTIEDLENDEQVWPVFLELTQDIGHNDLGTTDPHLLSEWDYEKNSKWTPSNVSRNSMKVVWWKCGAGHSYRAKITDRTIEQKGCPQCEAEFQQALPQMLIMMYGAQNGITVKSNSDSELGMRLVAYLPELHCAVDIAGATVTEKREQSVKAHICQSNRLGYYLIKRTADASQMAAEIKTLFIRNHIYLHTDSEKDVQVLRERFLEWKYRNACKLNGKY